MKLVDTFVIVSKGEFSTSKQWKEIQIQLEDAIESIVWPLGADGFFLNPESKGKKRGEGNGVVPIKVACISKLMACGWKAEEHVKNRVKGVGALDALKMTSAGYFAVEWETGNISSSHRALNKICLHVLNKELIGGVLIVPSNALKPYLTDRVGNIGELMPYIPLWQSLPFDEGVILIYVVENDGFRENIPRIAKGTDGRALI